MDNIAIVGAGLMGRLLALYLSKYVKVTVFERGSLDAENATGRVAAAMVAPTAESIVASPTIVELGQRSLVLWPSLLKAINCDVDFKRSGSLIVAHRQDQTELSQFIQRLKVKSSDWEIQSQTQLQQLEPELTPQFHQALWLPNEGHVDNTALYHTTTKRLRTSNIIVQENTGVQIDTQRIEISTNKGQKIPFDYIIDCRGLGAKAQLLDPNKSIRGVRGEVARVYAPEVKLSRPVRLMHPRYPLYIVPKSQDQYVIGATEIESEDDRKPTVRSTLELLSAAYSVHSGFAEAEVLALQSALRPALCDNEPQIIATQHMVQVNGLYRHGYLLAPSLIKQVIQHLIQFGFDIPNLSTQISNAHEEIT